MSERTADVRRDIELTRDRMSETIAELDTRVSSGVEGVKRKLDVVELIRQHPWPALAVAIGAGVALGVSGADERAAAAAASAAKRAPRAVAGATRRGAGKAAGAVRSKLARRNGAEDADEREARPAVAPVRPARAGLLARLADALADALERSELVNDVRRAAEELSRGSAPRARS